MRLGTETASVINNLYSRMTIGQPKPVVGMGVTLLSWTDRDAGTIVKVTEFGGSKVWGYEIEVTEDDARLIAGSCMSEDQTYEFSPRPDGYRSLYRFNKKSGEWVAGKTNPDTGKFNVSRGRGLRIGERDKYRDPSF